MAVTKGGMGGGGGRRGSGAGGDLAQNKLADNDRILKGKKSQHPRTPLIERKEPDGAQRKGNN